MAASATVLLTTLAIWLSFGVEINEVLRFFVYQFFYIFLPGWALYEVLQGPAAGALRRTVFAFALGQVTEVLLFALTAGIGARWLFALYPLAFLPLLLFARRHRRSTAGRAGARPDWRIDSSSLSAWSLALASVCLLTLAYLTLSHYLTTPLPGQIYTGFTYQHDYIFHLSLAGEALHHWPLTNPNIADTSLHYHWFSYFHIAGIAQVTGVPLPTIYFALFPASLLLLLLAELALAGVSLGGKLWAGPIAAFMLIFVGEIDFSRLEFNPFLEVMPIYLRYSPPFLFGATVFIPLLIVLCEALQTSRPSKGQWGMIVLLAAGCSGGEAAILPLTLGGIGGYFLYRRLIQRATERRAITAFVVIAVVFIASSLLLYTDGAGGLELSFPGAVQLAPPFVYALADVPGGGSFLFWALAATMLLLFLFGATAIGLLWLPRRLRALRAQEVVPISIFICGMLVLTFLFQESLSERYFAMYGAMAVIAVSAGGLARLLSRWRGASPRAVMSAVALAGACLLGFSFGVFDNRLGDSAGLGSRYLLTYGFFVSVVAAMAIWAWLTRDQSSGRRTLYPVIVVLAAAVINLPTDYRTSLDNLMSGEKVQAEVGPGLTPQLYEGLRWIEDHTKTDAVLAVNNLRTPDTKIYGPLYFYASAFTERRTLRQGWDYSKAAADLGFNAVMLLEKQPYAERLRLEDEVFQNASLPALRKLQHRWGVTHLIVDRATGPIAPGLRSIARLEYANSALLVFVPREP